MNIKLMRPTLSAALLFLAFSFLLIGCEKPEGKVGIDLLPGEDLLTVQRIDSFSVIAYTLEEDSLRTDKLNPALVGAYNDPVFGFAKASHVTELRLSTSNPDFLPLDTDYETQIEVDSVVLALYYQPDYLNQYVYGGSGEQYFQVYEISDTLSVDSFYYDNKTVNTIGDDLVLPGQNLKKPNHTDSVVVGGVKVAPQMRIPLNNVFADKVFAAAVNGPMTQADFVSLIKGICIKVDEDQQNLGKTGIINFNTFQQSQITMYYRNTNPNPDLSALDDTVAYGFDIRSNTGKFDTFEQDYSNANYSLSGQLNGDTTIGQRDLYVQSMAGTKMRVSFPTIENLKDSVGIAINSATLIVPVRDVPRKLDVPGRLLLFGIDEDQRIYLTDDQLDGDIGGFYNPTSNQYEFTITRQIQQILLGQKDNTGLEIVVTQAGNSANRVVLNGPDYPSAENPSDNLKLVITYSKF